MADDAGLKDFTKYLADELIPAKELTPDALGAVYTHRVHRAPQPPEDRVVPLAAALTVSTLASFAEYLAANVDGLKLDAHLVHVANPTTVQFVSALEPYHRRREVALAALYADGVSSQLDRWLDLEDAIVFLLSGFANTGDRMTVIQLLKTVTKSGTEIREDDGVSQKVAAQAGVTTVRVADVPNPVSLAPFRTFPEVEQVGSPFIIRLRDSAAGVQVLLKSADGGAWKLAATAAVGDWLKKALASTIGDTAPKVIF